jgi:hypothetical protein
LAKKLAIEQKLVTMTSLLSVVVTESIPSPKLATELRVKPVLASQREERPRGMKKRWQLSLC